MSEARTDTTPEDRTAEAAAGTGNGRHRGPASSDQETPHNDVGHGRHRRPTQESAAAN